MSNYRLIETAKDIITQRGRDTTVYTVEDMLSKIEEHEGRDERYYNGFRDYHGPAGDKLRDN